MARLTVDNAKVGDGCSVIIGSDSRAYTIVKRIGSQIYIQRDDAILNTKPEFITGGFAGHCTNNNELEYIYKQNPSAPVFKLSLRKGYFNLDGFPVVTGRKEKYDYNF